MAKVLQQLHDIQAATTLAQLALRCDFYRVNHANGYCQMPSGSQNANMGNQGHSTILQTTLFPISSIKSGDKILLILVVNKMDLQVVDPTN